MKLNIYNSLTRKIEEFRPLNPPSVGVYICGPTVYDYTHVGHVRTYTNSDVLVRTLTYLGYQPLVVMNITDVGHLTGDRDMGEDKMEKAAQKQKKSIWQVADFYTQHFWQTMKAVNINKPDVVCKATDHIEEMIDLVKRLEKNGLTYKTSDGVYFDTSKLKDYGKLAQLDIEGLKEGARVEKNPEKKNPTDFALWKFSPSTSSGQARRQMEWDAPFGKGFPGWHIECSAMSMKYLGKTFDMHTGGEDHVSVHHTNEIAQSEGVTGKPFVKYWFHSAFLLIEGQKMSKSLKNFYKIEDIKEKGFEPLALRYLYLTSHYRTQMNLTWEALEGAQKALNKLRSLVRPTRSGSGLNESVLKNNAWQKKFLKAITNDLNMPEALAVVWETAKSDLSQKEKTSLLLDFDKVLGLDLGKSKVKSQKLKIKNIKDNEIKRLLLEREKLRKEKKWDEADKIRKQIEKKGFIVEDSQAGSKIKSKKNAARR